MINLFLKMLLCPGVIFLADVISPVISYPNGLQIVFAGLIIGIIGYIMDLMLLINIGVEASAVIDTVVAAILVYFSQFFVPGAVVTFFGTLLAGVLLGISEYITHRLIMGDGYREKRTHY